MKSHLYIALAALCMISTMGMHAGIPQAPRAAAPAGKKTTPPTPTKQQPPRPEAPCPESKDKAFNPDCEPNSLSLCKLCVEKAHVKCLEGEQATLDKACVREQVVDRICIGSAAMNEVCNERAKTNELCVSRQAEINRLCANQIAVNELCVGGNLKQCSFFSARVAAGFDYFYTLGDVVTFDTILSDPSGSIQQFPTRYVAPETGTYINTVQIVQRDLTGPGLILGTPIAAIEIYVNGILRRQRYEPFLAFNNRQAGLVSHLIYLSQGDELLVRYKVLSLDAVAGLVEYPGSVVVIGGAGFSFRSFMSVHYLSSDCETLECPVCDIDCTPCQVSCQPCTECFAPCEPTTEIS